MRLDVFLKLSRLVPRRTVANQICDNGLVKVNGVKAKPSKEIREGDEIEIKRGNKLLKIKVSFVPAKKQVVSKKDASKLYEILQEAILPEEDFGIEIANNTED
ncbi:MAG: RNA-binding S4 domain-containing protein [Acidobacteria bacterium]|jgi:ribosomal 50S subunit-recycling heat shock protein|nr:MAG: RNA-binding S4 domain-containing protein [Acidobacteriota bacterium]GIU81633.1 MAG: hypothetical protein KatS3mg006_0697 [Pyrinomonadaceae bacterium]